MLSIDGGAGAGVGIKVAVGAGFGAGAGVGAEVEVEERVGLDGVEGLTAYAETCTVGTAGGFGVTESDARFRRRRNGTKAKPVLHQHRQHINQSEEHT